MQAEPTTVSHQSPTFQRLDGKSGMIVIRDGLYSLQCGFTCIGGRRFPLYLLLDIDEP